MKHHYPLQPLAGKGEHNCEPPKPLSVLERAAAAGAVALCLALSSHANLPPTAQGPLRERQPEVPPPEPPQPVSEPRGWRKRARANIPPSEGLVP